MDVSMGANMEITNRNSGAVDSFWQATGVPAHQFPSLRSDLATDVVVVGGGFTGLSASRELEKQGVDHVVIEANQIGWGASGRNGGMAVLRYKRSWSQLARSFGDEVTRQMYRWINEAVDAIEHNVAEFSIPCDFRRYGHLTAAPHRRSVERLEADRRWLNSQVGDRSITIHGADETAHLTGSTIYTGSYLDPRSAGFHPLNYCRGLASGLDTLSVPIFEETPVWAIRHEKNGLILQTPEALIRAKKVLLCTSAYLTNFALSKDLERRILPISVSVVSTEALSDDLIGGILPEGHIVTDTKNLVNYYRVVNGSLLFGGRGALTSEERTQNYRRLIRQLVDTFPQLRGVDIKHRWSGRIGLSVDDFPHVGTDERGLFYAIGYGGRGVALSHLLGARLARLVAGEKIALGPMSGGAFKSIPFQSWRLPLMHAGAAYYRVKDAFGV